MLYNSDDVLKLLVSCRLQIIPMGIYGIRIEGPNRRHRCDTDQESFKGQVSK